MAPIFFLNLGEGSGKKIKMMTGCLQTRNRDDSAKTSLDKEVFFGAAAGKMWLGRQGGFIFSLGPPDSPGDLGYL
jgi:hypothetical protein